LAQPLARTVNVALIFNFKKLSHGRFNAIRPKRIRR
jgi:hypothetical protein